MLYEGEVKWKEPDYYELHVIYQLEEPAKMTEEETTMEIKEDHTEKNDSPVKRQGPFWYLVRTGLMITVAIGVHGFHRTDPFSGHEKEIQKRQILKIPKNTFKEKFIKNT